MLPDLGTARIFFDHRSRSRILVDPGDPASVGLVPVGAKTGLLQAKSKTHATIRARPGGAMTGELEHYSGLRSEWTPLLTFYSLNPGFRWSP